MVSQIEKIYKIILLPILKISVIFKCIYLIDLVMMRISNFNELKIKSKILANNSEIFQLK